MVRFTHLTSLTQQINLELLYRPYDQRCPPMWMQEGSHDSAASTSGPRRASQLYSEDMKAQDSDRARAIHPGFSYEGQLWEIVRGVLWVTVERAENLVSQDIYSLSDPYVVLKTKKSQHRKQTKVPSAAVCALVYAKFITDSRLLSVHYPFDVTTCHAWHDCRLSSRVLLGMQSTHTSCKKYLAVTYLLDVAGRLQVSES